MAALNETKEKIGVVKSVGGFANALQQIAAMRMTSLRDKVLSSKRFVDEASEILRELNLQKELHFKKEFDRANKHGFKKSNQASSIKAKRALIVVTSNQGLCGKFNAEIFRQLEGHILVENPDADIFIVGKKGQEHYLTNKKYNYKFFPYSLKDNFDSTDLLRLVNMFPYYESILMVYSRFINTILRDVVETLLVTPPTGEPEVSEGEEIRYIFEPSIDELIKEVSARLRAATFQQQVLDSRLAQFSAQMVGMQAASENAKILTEELNHEYNKIRRKIIDKKIAEVLGGSALW
ncbi:MAG: F0F1 ATP synthase subunit gamma [bacterium]